MKFSLKITLISFFLSHSFCFAQDVDIVPYLKQIESGELAAVKEVLPELKSRNPESPAVMFLEGVLTEDGQQAITIYQNIIDKYPKSKYADASVYRVFSYFYALGFYEAAERMRRKLNSDYPDSPYRKLADANQIPGRETRNETETVVSQPVQQPVQTVNYRFTIQAGAFSNPSNAENLKNDFVKAGYQTEISEKNVGGTLFQVVYVGKFTSRKDADDFLHIINSRFNLTGRVVEITH